MSGLRRASFAAMGTRVELVLDRDADRDAEPAVQALFAEGEAVLSRFRPDSALRRVNAAAGRPAPAPPPTPPPTPSCRATTTACAIPACRRSAAWVSS